MSDRVLTEVHAHTKEVSPCGWLLADELIRRLSAKGYGAVVITDHYVPGERTDAESRDAFLAGYRAAKAAAEPLGIVALPGIEIRFKDKTEDFLVYGMTEEDILSLPDNVCDGTVRAFHGLSKEHGWLVYQAHPFRPKMLPADPSEIDGMEIFNGNPRHDSRNRLAASFAALHGLRTVCGSDVHRAGDEGMVGLMAPREALTPTAFAAWLRATPHPRAQYPEPPRDGIRYVAGAIPGKGMLRTLYQDAGWSTYTDHMDSAVSGLESSLRVVTAWDDTTLIGMARAVGDGHTILYIQDILVLGAYRRRGIGRGLLYRLMAPYKDVRQVVLIADDTPSLRDFCKACGFAPLGEYQCAGFIRLL